MCHFVVLCAMQSIQNNLLLHTLTLQHVTDGVIKLASLFNYVNIIPLDLFQKGLEPSTAKPNSFKGMVGQA